MSHSLKARKEMMDFDREAQAETKLKGCVRLAKASTKDYLETKDKRFITIRKEAMQDARYWRGVLFECRFKRIAPTNKILSAAV